MEFRQMTSAFLFNSRNEVLLIKKPSGRLFNGEHWSSIGGHLEPEGLNQPMIGCYREVFEEAGIHRHDLMDLKLKYIVLRKKVDEVRQHFIYFGSTSS
ncbi:NUDIX hydrolase [Paenibacillus mendelii]|uniref:NUDIX hydrolase n=1 Tax=Paenibacillus mendelii TaxID=206163 RepID=A0ABV6JFT4_9BACL|nr:NUDIX hydrolase [Paenibacillus mendelii]MCQ6557663.1 NUDIX hydrolase [Paenibacillus mendelii]